MLLQSYCNVRGGHSTENDLKTPKALNNRLRRDKPAFQRVGVTIEFGKTNGRRWVQITKSPGTVAAETGTVPAETGTVVDASGTVEAENAA